MLNSESESKQENRQEMTQVKKPKKVSSEINSEINPGISPEAGQTGKKKIETSVIFLWGMYAITMIFIILVVCDNLQP